MIVKLRRVLGLQARIRIIPLFGTVILTLMILLLVLGFKSPWIGTTKSTIEIQTIKIQRRLGGNHDRAPQRWKQMFDRANVQLDASADTIYVLTPTYSRLTQMADLTKMAQSLQIVKEFVVWFVIEDANTISDKVHRLLNRIGVRHVHAAIPHLGSRRSPYYKGVTQRNFCLYFLRRYFRHSVATSVHGWVYMADDDNVYDSRLFDKIRRIQHVGVWPVAFAGHLAVESMNYSTRIDKLGTPKVAHWLVQTMPGRSFAVDMAGFAVSIHEILTHPEVVMRPNKLPEYLFLEDLGFNPRDAEGVAYDTNDVLVWHTKFKDPNLDGELKFRKTYGFNSFDRLNV